MYQLILIFIIILGITLSTPFIDICVIFIYQDGMNTVISLKMDSRMKVALKKLADSQFISVSAVLKQAAEKHLLDAGIDWREDSASPDSEKPK